MDIQHLYQLDSRKRKYYLSVFAHIPLYSEQIISSGGGNPVTMCNGFHLKLYEVCKGHPAPRSQLKSREKGPAAWLDWCRPLLISAAHRIELAPGLWSSPPVKWIISPRSFDRSWQEGFMLRCVIHHQRMKMTAHTWYHSFSPAEENSLAWILAAVNLCRKYASAIITTK